MSQGSEDAGEMVAFVPDADGIGAPRRRADGLGVVTELPHVEVGFLVEVEGSGDRDVPVVVDVEGDLGAVLGFDGVEGALEGGSEDGDAQRLGGQVDRMAGAGS